MKTDACCVPTHLYLTIMLWFDVEDDCYHKELIRATEAWKRELLQVPILSPL